MAASKAHRRQVQAESLLRFGPQLDALALLLRQARGDRDQGIRVAESTARALAVNAQAADPRVRQIGKEYLAQLQQAQAGLGKNTAGLGESAAPYVASSARDFQAAEANRAGEAARSRGELVSRGMDAQAGRLAAVQGVRQQYGKERQQIADQLTSLSGQQGAFSASRLEELLGVDKTAADKAREGAANRKNARLVAGVDDTGKVTPGGPKDPKLKPGAKKLATPGQHGKFQDTVESLGSWIKAHRGDYKSRSAMAADLLNGVPGTSVIDPKTGAELKDPGVPKAGSALALSVALDLVFDQHVSRRNVDRLHKRRYSVKKLGFQTKAPSSAPAYKGPDVAPGDRQSG